MFELDDQETVFRLVFPDLPDLSVGVREISVDAYLDLLPLAESVQGATTANIGEVSTAFTQLTDLFAAAVADWNVTRTGEPVPCTGPNVRALGLRLSMRMVMAWIEAQGGVEAPLGPVSPGGESALVGSLPMVPLTSNPVS